MPNLVHFQDYFARLNKSNYRLLKTPFRLDFGTVSALMVALQGGDLCLEMIPGLPCLRLMEIRPDIKVPWIVSGAAYVSLSYKILFF